MDVHKAHEVRDLGTDFPPVVAAYEAAEAEHRGDDIVMVGSDSLETVKLTHSSYFASSEDDLRKRSGERSRRSTPDSEATGPAQTSVKRTPHLSATSVRTSRLRALEPPVRVGTGTYRRARMPVRS